MERPEDIIQQLNHEIKVLSRMYTNGNSTLAALKAAKGLIVALMARAEDVVDYLGAANYRERQTKARKYIRGIEYRLDG